MVYVELQLSQIVAWLSVVILFIDHVKHAIAWLRCVNIIQKGQSVLANTICYVCPYKIILIYIKLAMTTLVVENNGHWIDEYPTLIRLAIVIFARSWSVDDRQSLSDRCSVGGAFWQPVSCQYSTVYLTEVQYGTVP